VTGPESDRFTLVCDPGIDDMLALMYLTGAGAPPGRVVATAGNAPLPVTVRNAAAICATLGLPRAVVAGCDRALAGAYPGWGTQFHAADGLGGVAGWLAPGPSPLPPVPFTPDVLAGRVLATGALTAVALALRAGCSPEVTWMGGACDVDGNVTAVAEFNAWLDPEAADETLRAGQGVAIVPLDVTQQVTWDRFDLAELAGLGGLARIAADACGWLHRFGPVTLPDVVAAVAFLRPELFAWRSGQVRCDVGAGPTRAMTTQIGTADGPVRIATEVDAGAVRKVLGTALAALG
jgi:inosine-uridine nucleoside N-ribohydrolase